MVSGVKPPSVPGIKVPVPGATPTPVQVTPPPVPVSSSSSYDFRVNRWASLASRIRARDKSLTVQTLYQLGAIAVGPAIVGERPKLKVDLGGGKETWKPTPNLGPLTVSPNLSEAADILSQAAKDNFLYLFKSGKRIFDENYYPGATAVSYYHYNLPFFFSLSFSMNGVDWAELVAKIGRRNRELGRVLSNLGKEIAAIEKDLLRTHPLLQTAAVAPAQPGTGSSSQSAGSSKPVSFSPAPPSASKRSGPPPIPGRDTDGDPTVGEKRKT